MNDSEMFPVARIVTDLIILDYYIIIIIITLASPSLTSISIYITRLLKIFLLMCQIFDDIELQFDPV
jgi:hypothetical protein